MTSGGCDNLKYSEAELRRLVEEKDAEIELLRKQRSDLTDRWECDCASRDAEIERLKNQVAELQEEDER